MTFLKLLIVTDKNIHQHQHLQAAQKHAKRAGGELIEIAPQVQASNLQANGAERRINKTIAMSQLQQQRASEAIKRVEELENI